MKYITLTLFIISFLLVNPKGSFAEVVTNASTPSIGSEKQEVEEIINRNFNESVDYFVKNTTADLNNYFKNKVTGYVTSAKDYLTNNLLNSARQTLLNAGQDLLNNLQNIIKTQQKTS